MIIFIQSEVIANNWNGADSNTTGILTSMIKKCILFFSKEEKSGFGEELL